MAPSVQRRKVWLTPTTRVPCSNAAKTRNPLKLAGVPQHRQQISAVRGPKFTILWGHVEEVLLFNKFFRLSIHTLVAKIYGLSKLCDGAEMASFCILYFQRGACSTGNGRFPDNHFPGRRLPDRTFPEQSLSRTRRFPDNHFPEQTFPGQTFPGQFV